MGGVTLFAVGWDGCKCMQCKPAAGLPPAAWAGTGCLPAHTQGPCAVRSTSIFAPGATHLECFPCPLPAGTDGCSDEPLSLLISTPVSRTTSFLAPTALALIKLNYRWALKCHCMPLPRCMLDCAGVTWHASSAAQKVGAAPARLHFSWATSEVLHTCAADCSGPGSPAAAAAAAPSGGGGGGGGGLSGGAIAGIAIGVVVVLAAAAAVGWVLVRRRRRRRHASLHDSGSKTSSGAAMYVPPGLKAVVVAGGRDSRAPSRAQSAIAIPSRPASAVSVGTPRSVIVSRTPVPRSPFARGPSFARGEAGPFVPSALPSLAYLPGSPKGSASPVTTVQTGATLPPPTEEGSPGSSGESGAAAAAAAGGAGDRGPSRTASEEEQMLPELKEHIAQVGMYVASWLAACRHAIASGAGCVSMAISKGHGAYG